MNHVSQPAKTFPGRVVVFMTALLCGGLGSPAEADPFSVPALNSPANDTHLVGKLVWVDLETTDLPGAKSFYASLFGWTYRDYRSDGVDYTVVLADGKPVAGMVRRRILNDAEARSLDTWGSPSLLARDPGRDAVFYQELFGYSILGEPTVRDFDRIRLSIGAHERATVRRLPGGANAPQPQWISFVRVASTADTIRQALKLGGRTVLDSARDGDGAVTAILSDPTGAAFGVAQSSN